MKKLAKATTEELVKELAGRIANDLLEANHQAFADDVLCYVVNDVTEEEFIASLGVDCTASPLAKTLLKKAAKKYKSQLAA